MTDGTFWICPLYAFNCNIEGSDRIDLDKGVALWRIPQDLKRRFTQHVKWVTQVPTKPRVRWTTTSDYPLVCTFDLIAAIRMQHEGPVLLGSPARLKISNGEFELGMVSIVSAFSKPSGYFTPDHYSYTGEPYELLETEVDTLRGFWNDFQDKRLKGKVDDLEIALGRFNSSYDEGLEDRLLDHMVALESLYLGDLQELSYKLALRAAFLLERGKKGRIKVFKRLKQAYHARSKVIHGQKPPKNLPELVADTEEYLRQSIKRFIKLSEQYNLNDLRERFLDQNIIEAGQLLKAK